MHPTLLRFDVIKKVPDRRPGIRSLHGGNLPRRRPRTVRTALRSPCHLLVGKGKRTVPRFSVRQQRMRLRLRGFLANLTRSSLLLFYPLAFFLHRYRHGIRLSDLPPRLYRCGKGLKLIGWFEVRIISTEIGVLLVIDHLANRQQKRAWNIHLIRTHLLNLLVS